MPPVIETQHSSPENQLLNELRSTVKNRWNEFDDQLPGLLKNASPEYKKIKAAYESLSNDLAGVGGDQELKQNESIKAKMDVFLGQLDDYLKKDNRDKKYDATLIETSRQMSALRNKIYVEQLAQQVQTESGKLQQEVIASKKQESMMTEQTATAATVGTGLVASIESTGKNAEEAAKKVMKPLEKIKKWSSDIGDAWDAGWELVKKGDISKGISLFFAVLFGGNLKDALAKYAGKKEGEKPDAPTTNESSDQNTDNGAQYIASTIVFRSINKRVLDKYPTNIQSTGNAILNSTPFMNLNFSLVDSMMRTDFNVSNGTIKSGSRLHRYIDTNLIKPLGNYPQNSDTYKSIAYALQTIYHQEDNVVGKHIASLYSKMDSKCTIRQAVESLSDEINIADQLMKVDIQDLSQGMGDFLKIDPSGKVEGPLSVALQKGFSAGTLAAFVPKFGLALPSTFNEKDFSIDTSFNSSKAKPEEVKKLIDFRARLTNSIVNNNKLTFGNNDIKGSIQAEMSKLTYLESLKMYSVLGGESDTSKLGGARMTLLYSTLLGLLDNDSQAQGAYKSALCGELYNSLRGRASAIPEEVQDFLKKATSNLGDYFKEKAKALGLEWFGSLTENTTMTLLATAGVLAFFWYGRFFAVRTSAAGMATKLFGKA